MLKAIIFQNFNLCKLDAIVPKTASITTAKEQKVEKSYFKS